MSLHQRVTEAKGETPYLGVFLTKQSEAKLKKAIPPAFNNKSGNHLTIQFVPSEEQLARFQKKIGKKVTLSATHLIQTDSYQAIRVNGIKTALGHPHITISWKEGSNPAKGNRAMKENKGQAIQPWLKLQGVYDTWPRTMDESSLYDRIITEAKINLGYGKLTKTFKQVAAELGGKTWIVFDTETTGFKPGPTTMITELAAVAIDIDTGKKVGTFHKKAKLTPAVKKLMKQQAGKPTKGKSIKELLKMTSYGGKGAPYEPLLDVVVGFREFVKGHSNAVLVAQNAKFDMMQVNVALKNLGEKPLPKLKVYDTVSLTRIYVYPLARTLQKTGSPKGRKMVSAFFAGGKFSAKLDILGKVFNVKGDHWHSGISDALQLARIFWKMISFFKKHASLADEALFQEFMKKEAAREWSRQWYFKAGDDWRQKRGIA